MELRPLAEADLPALEAWLPETARQAGCERWSSAGALHCATGSRPVLIGEERGAQSFLEYASGEPARGAARVCFLAVSPDRRRHGAGHRSAIALEALLPPTVRRIYVCVPARLGLALYFWLRLGYRPLTQREWPEVPRDAPSVWMMRKLR